MTKLIDIIQEKENLSKKEARQRLQEVKSKLDDYLDLADLDSAYSILEEEFGVEPDYLMELLC